MFQAADGSSYVPLNYRGQWQGRVTLRQALAHSMNVPSLQVLDAVGIPEAVVASSRLLGISDLWEIERTFPLGYPLGLGVATVSPLQMARAYAVFANDGRSVEPVVIRRVTDREGRQVHDLGLPASAGQILTPQEAYLMVSLLESTVESGTLRWAVSTVGGLGRPVAGKTGTTQNWSDAWTIGFTPQLSTAVWFGFDRGSGSLGINLSGALSAGPVWAEFMKEAHRDLPVAPFRRPPAGLVEAAVCRYSGLLPTVSCGTDTHVEIFLTGTEPRSFCTYHQYVDARREELKRNIRGALFDLGSVAGAGTGGGAASARASDVGSGVDVGSVFPGFGLPEPGFSEEARGGGLPSEGNPLLD